MVEKYDVSKGIKQMLISKLHTACLNDNIKDIARLSRAYNDFCQAQRNQAMPKVELSEQGITYGYREPTVDRFNNAKK